jgi:hypothetical protein
MRTTTCTSVVFLLSICLIAGTAAAQAKAPAATPAKAPAATPAKAPAATPAKAPAAAAAAPAKAPDANAKAEAERAGKEGERLLAQHEPARALEHLQRAYRLSNNVKYLLPLGLAYAEAERPLDALDALGRYLREAPALPDAKRKEIGAKLGVMLDQVAAVVTIEASRENAGVKVDGRAIGTTPLEAPLRLMPGKHELVLQPAPTDPSSGARQVIDVKPGERRTVKLEPGTRSRFLEPQSSNETGGAQGDDGEEEEEKAPPKRRKVAATVRKEPEEQAVKIEWNPRQIHKKWWFWTAVGGATVLVVGLAAGLGARSASSAAGEMIPKSPDWKGGVVDARSGALLALAGSWP